MDAYRADPSLKGKLRRRWARLTHRKPAKVRLERPMVSFSFDDAPSSAAVTGAPLLERRGVRGAWFVCMGLAGKVGPMGRNADVDELSRLIEAGHEIGCHTHSHLDCGRAAVPQIEADIVKNRAALAGLGARSPSTFAYPYGDVAPRAKAALDHRFKILRALHHGLVETGSDLNQAPAVGIEGQDGEAVAEAWIGRAVRRRAWLILYTHDVGQTPSPWGCTPDALGRLIDRALEAGAEIVTVEEGCRRIGA